MLRKLFLNTDNVFCPNVEVDKNHKEPISLKNLGQGDAAWYTKKTMFGWNLDTVAHLLCLTPKRQ